MLHILTCPCESAVAKDYVNGLYLRATADTDENFVLDNTGKRAIITNNTVVRI